MQALYAPHSSLLKPSRTNCFSRWKPILLGTNLLLASCDTGKEPRDLLARARDVQEQLAGQSTHAASEEEKSAAREKLHQANRAHLEFMDAYQEEIVRDYLQRTKEAPNATEWKLAEGFYRSIDCSTKWDALAPVLPLQRPSAIPEEEWKCYQESYLAQVECIHLTRQLFDPDRPVTGDEREALLARHSQALLRAYRF